MRSGSDRAAPERGDFGDFETHRPFAQATASKEHGWTWFMWKLDRSSVSIIEVEFMHKRSRPRFTAGSKPQKA